MENAGESNRQLQNAEGKSNPLTEKIDFSFLYFV